MVVGFTPLVILGAFWVAVKFRAIHYSFGILRSLISAGKVGVPAEAVELCLMSISTIDLVP